MCRERLSLDKKKILCHKYFKDHKNRKDPKDSKNPKNHKSRKDPKDSKDPKDHKKRKERGLARRTLVATRTPPKLRSNSSLPATSATSGNFCSWIISLNSVPT